MDKRASFKWHYFQVDFILSRVRWYQPYSLSFRDLEELILGWESLADCMTFSCWVQRYAPELDWLC